MNADSGCIKNRRLPLTMLLVVRFDDACRTVNRWHTVRLEDEFGVFANEAITTLTERAIRSEVRFRGPDAQ